MKEVDYYPKTRRIRSPGSTAAIIANDLEKQNEQNKEQKNKVSDDTANRRDVVNLLKKYMQDDSSLKEAGAVEKLIREEPAMVDNFSYFSKNGIDIRSIFLNWIRSSKKMENKDITR